MIGATATARRAVHTETDEVARAPRILRVSFAVLVTGMMVSIPWPTIWLQQYGAPMEDRRVYEGQVINGYLGFDVKAFDDLQSYVVNEYLWGWFLNFAVRTMGIPLEVTFGLISAFVTFVACLLVIRHAPLIYTVLLFNPSFVNLAFSQMRIAMAVALMCLAYLLRGRQRIVLPVRGALLLASCLVHTSMAVFVLLFVLAFLASRRPDVHRPGARYAVLVMSGVAAAVVLGPLRGGLLSELGDRRADADYISSSLKFYVIWFLMALIFTIVWNRVKLSFVSAYAFAALSAILVGIGLDVYVNRVIAIALPFLIAAMYAFPRPWRGFFVIAYVGYTVIYWAYWLNLMQ